MPVVSLTKKFLSAVKPQKTILTFWDKNIKGLMLRVHPTGRKSMYSVIRLNGVRTFRFIGTYPSINPDAAKQIVKQDLFRSIGLPINSNCQKQFKHIKSKQFKHYLNQYIDEKKNELKDKTKKLYTSLLNVHIIPTFGEIPISEISHSMIVSFKNSMRHKSTTYNSCHRLLSALFNYCVSHSIIQTNPLINVKKYKDNKRTGFFSNIQYKEFISSLHCLLASDKITKNSAGCILFIALCGCRLSEAMSCKWAYVDFTNNVINLPDSKTGAKKLYMGQALKTLLQSMPTHSIYVFPGRDGVRPITKITKPFKLILQHANITENFTIHHLRHSFISCGANSGVPINAVQLTVGHASQSTTERYTHTDEKLAHATARRIEDIITEQSGDVMNKIVQFMR